MNNRGPTAVRCGTPKLFSKSNENNKTIKEENLSRTKNITFEISYAVNLLITDGRIN